MNPPNETSDGPNNTRSGFTYLDHTADVWVHAWGPTLEEAFQQTALALMDTMLNVEDIIVKTTKIHHMKEYTIGSLLIGFLSEFLYLFDVDLWVFNEINISSISKTEGGMYQINAETKGEEFNLERHEPDTEVKAITYSYLEIKESPEKTEIKVVFDI